MELKEGIKYSDLVLDVPLGLLALDAELASEVDLVAGAHLDCPKCRPCHWRVLNLFQNHRAHPIWSWGGLFATKVKLIFSTTGALVTVVKV